MKRKIHIGNPRPGQPADPSNTEGISEPGTKPVEQTSGLAPDGQPLGRQPSEEPGSATATAAPQPGDTAMVTPLAGVEQDEESAQDMLEDLMDSLADGVLSISDQMEVGGLQREAGVLEPGDVLIGCRLDQRKLFCTVTSWATAAASNSCRLHAVEIKFQFGQLVVDSLMSLPLTAHDECGVMALVMEAENQFVVPCIAWMARLHSLGLDGQQRLMKEMLAKPAMTGMFGKRTMRPVAMLVSSGGFLGLLALGVLSATRDLAAALTTHAILFAVFLHFSLWRRGRLRGWLHMRTGAGNSLTHLVVAAMGLTFLIAGSHIAICAHSGTDPNSMDKAQQIYFGLIFASIGGGIFPIAVSDWIAYLRAKPRL